MSRLVAGLTVAVGMAAVAAPVPKDPAKAPLYFATEVGAEWVYDTRDGKETLVVTRVEDKGGAKMVTVSRVSGLGPVEVRERVAVSSAGVARHQVERFVLDPPMWMLKPPADPAPEWVAVVPAQFGLRGSKSTLTVVGLEDVEVPAGKFRALRVDRAVAADAGNEASRSSSWWAADVGLVKWKRDKDVTALVSFKPGKK